MCFGMFENVDIKDKLDRLRNKIRSEGDFLVTEANRILQKDLFTEKKILENLKTYNNSFEILNEEDLDEDLIFTIHEIKQIAIIYRLKFLESKFFKSDIPYEAVLKIKELNDVFHKEIKLFKILAPGENFIKRNNAKETMLFAKTNYDNYYLIHRWGNKLEWNRKLKYWPLRNFENLVITILICTLIIAFSLPTHLITLDRKAEYWSGYRAAAFFHLLIFNFGVTAYITFAFAKNFSSSIWNRSKDFN
jgi:hypothetical protein